MLTPGASRFNIWALLEKYATWSCLSVAPTLIADEIQAGVLTRLPVRAYSSAVVGGVGRGEASLVNHLAA